jgi:hypothetical protein
MVPPPAAEIAEVVTGGGAEVATGGQGGGPGVTPSLDVQRDVLCTQGDLVTRPALRYGPEEVLLSVCGHREQMQE